MICCSILGGLTPAQWEVLQSVNDLLVEDYRVRRETLIKVTVILHFEYSAFNDLNVASFL